MLSATFWRWDELSPIPAVSHPNRGEKVNGGAALQGVAAVGSEGEPCRDLTHSVWPESREWGAFGDERLLPTHVGGCWSTLIALLRKPSQSVKLR